LHNIGYRRRKRQRKEGPMNVVTLIGNLATPVDLRDVAGDKRVATFLLAVDRPGGGDADFVRVSAWDKQAELCHRFLAKGKRVGIDGRLRSRSWEEDGKRRTVVEVVAHHVQFLSPPEKETTDVPFEAAAG
jgi:single-strand DNA-binding protein